MDIKCRCEGTGWLRNDKEVNEDGFGKLVPCECNQEAMTKLQILKPVPDLHPSQLKWLEYTE